MSRRTDFIPLISNERVDGINLVQLQFVGLYRLVAHVAFLITVDLVGTEYVKSASGDLAMFSGTMQRSSHEMAQMTLSSNRPQ